MLPNPNPNPEPPLLLALPCIPDPDPEELEKEESGEGLKVLGPLIFRIGMSGRDERDSKRWRAVSIGCTWDNKEEEEEEVDEDGGWV